LLRSFCQQYGVRHEEARTRLERGGSKEPAAFSARLGTVCAAEGRRELSACIAGADSSASLKDSGSIKEATGEADRPQHAAELVGWPAWRQIGGDCRRWLPRAGCPGCACRPPHLAPVGHSPSRHTPRRLLPGHARHVKIARSSYGSPRRADGGPQDATWAAAASAAGAAPQAAAGILARAQE
jgi:hypothetical protein